MTNKVGERYQITIDKKVRRELAVKPGDLAIERVEDGRLVVEFMPGPHRESLLGIFRRADLPPITDWDDFRDRVWRARGAEIAEVLREDSERHRSDRG